MRPVALLLFTALVWLAWSQRQSSPPEYTFEVSRQGATPVDYPGPFTYPDFIRLLVRRAGPFRLDVTRDLRERPAAELNLWDITLPEVLKLEVGDGRLNVVAQPGRLRLGVDALYNLPVLIRNTGSQPLDVKLVGRLGDDGPTDRFTARPGVSYFSLNWRPRIQGSAVAHVSITAPAETGETRAISFPVDVVGWGLLRLKINQPARVYVTGADGLSYTPARTLARITWSSGDYFYYTRGGEDEIWLPEGPASLEAVRGFEYAPATATPNIAAGRTAASLLLERRQNLPADGWYSGDVHIHANYNNHEFITPEDVRDQVQAEDLHVANLMVANSSGPHIHDEQYFEGRPHRLSTPLHILYWVEEMRNAGLYGHMCLTGLKSLVQPQNTGFANNPAWPWDFPPNHVQALDANRQGGAASYAHPGYNFTPDPQTMSARELPVDLALGSINAMDVMSNANEDASVPMWYRLLNTGLKCAISAGTDSFTNRRHHWLPGAQRVYVQVPSPFTYDRWIENYKAGRSFATNHPLVRFTVDGKEPGAEIRLSGPTVVTAEVSVTSLLPFDTVELVANGRVVATSSSGRLRATHKLDQSAWLAARVRGPYHRLLTNDRFLYAHTSPVYCYLAGRPIASRDDAQFFVQWIDQLLAMAEKRGRYQNDAQKQEVLTLFRKGRAYYEGVARP